MNKRNFPPDFLQQFAEDGQGTGVTAPDAGVPSGVEAPAAGEQDRTARFDALIQGEFKDLYDKRVQDTIQKRLKSQKQTLEKYQALTPTLERLAERYGIADPTDVQAWEQAISPGVRRENVQRLCSQWESQEAEARQMYPSLNLRAELGNPRFRGLLQGGVDVRTAYEVVHKDEIISGAMQFASQTAARKMANHIAAQGLRPMENGARSQGAALVKADAALMTKQERDAIRRRVAGGEVIRL